jgi:hypothetical protein
VVTHLNGYVVLVLVILASLTSVLGKGVSTRQYGVFIDTKRGGKTLHFEGYIYTKIRDGENGFQFWRCQNHKAEQEMGLGLAE